MHEVAEDPYPSLEEGWDVIAPACTDCIFVPETCLEGRFYCKAKQGFTEIRKGVCGRFVPNYESMDEFLDRYPHLKGIE